ncbi:MAG: sensor histidine kinase, partial [Candidatus Dormibacteria bacterium]
MTGRFQRRLVLIATLQLAVVLWLLVIGIALFAFGAYAGALKGDLNATLARTRAALGNASDLRDARVAAGAVATQYIPSDALVALLDQYERCAVFRTMRSELPTISCGSRGGPPHDPMPHGPFAQPILGLATAFGVGFVHARVGGVDVIVKQNDATVTAVAGAYVPVALAGLVFAYLIGLVVARILTPQMLRPLLDVSAALERFAAGDLTPAPIAADERQELGGLAVAYNGAVAQMSRAFDERDRSNAAMRQFMADAGHQLRTPLTVIRGFIGILRKGDLRNPEDRERILGTMARQSTIMAQLIDKLMLLERWEEPRDERPAEPVEVARVVGDVVGPIAEANPERALTIDAPGAPLAAIDPSDLGHALNNLVDNALRYTAGPIETRVRELGDRIVIEVADRGPGMSAAECAQIFERFARGKRRDVEGSGLGLAIARRAVERSGGTLVVESS